MEFIVFLLEFSGSGVLGTDVKTNVKSVDSNVKVTLLFMVV